MSFLDDFQRKGERGSKTMVSETRSDLTFIIFSRVLAVGDHGISWRLRGLWESRLTA